MTPLQPVPRLSAADRARLRLAHALLCGVARTADKARWTLDARNELGVAMHQAEAAAVGHCGEMETMSVKQATADLAPMKEDSVRAAFRRHGDVVGIKRAGEREIRVRTSWVAEMLVRRALS